MKFSDLKFTPSLVGVSAKVFFPNGYGASIITSEFSYGGDAGLYELAVLKGSKDSYDLCYSTKITDDVLGRLSEVDVLDYLKQIESL